MAKGFDVAATSVVGGDTLQLTDLTPPLPSAALRYANRDTGETTELSQAVQSIGRSRDRL